MLAYTYEQVEADDANLSGSHEVQSLAILYILGKTKAYKRSKMLFNIYPIQFY